MACGVAFVYNHKLIIWELKAFGANFTAALLPVGDKQSSPTTQMMYDRMTQFTDTVLPPEVIMTTATKMYEIPANQAPQINLVARLGWRSPIFFQT